MSRVCMQGLNIEMLLGLQSYLNHISSDLVVRLVFAV